MNKAVYTWRVDPVLKQELEAFARAENKPLGQVLTEIVEERLRAANSNPSIMSTDTKAQETLKLELMEFIGSFHGPSPGQSATNAVVREAFSQKFEEDARRRKAPRAR